MKKNVEIPNFNNFQVNFEKRFIYKILNYLNHL